MKRIFKTTACLMAAITFISFGLMSCNTTKPIDKAQLEGYWVLKSLKGQDASTAFTGSLPHIEFDFEKNMVYGNGGCNTFTGQFTLTEQNVFTAPNLASTMMACLPDNKEPEFMAALNSSELTLSIDENNLLNFTHNDEVLLQFEKSTPPAESPALEPVNAETLAGSWTLSSMANEDIATLFTDKVATMEIAQDGKVSGNAGCNTYRTSYTLEGDVLTFGPAMSTKMACPSLDGETKFLNHLSTPLQATISGSKLTLLKDGNMVLEFTKATTAEAN